MKFKLVENFSGQTELKWDIIHNCIDPTIRKPRPDDYNDCRYADIHHIDSNHHRSFNNLMLLPHSEHSTITDRIKRLTREDKDPNQESIRLTLDYIKQNKKYFVGKKHPDSRVGIIIVWSPYIRNKDGTIQIDNAMKEIGKDFPEDEYKQLTFFDNEV